MATRRRPAVLSSARTSCSNFGRFFLQKRIKYAGSIRRFDLINNTVISIAPSQHFYVCSMICIKSALVLPYSDKILHVHSYSFPLFICHKVYSCEFYEWKWQAPFHSCPVAELCTRSHAVALFLAQQPHLGTAAHVHFISFKLEFSGWPLNAVVASFCVCIASDGYNPSPSWPSSSQAVFCVQCDVIQWLCPRQCASLPRA